MKGIVLALMMATAQVMSPEGGANNLPVMSTEGEAAVETSVRQIHHTHELDPPPSTLAPAHDYHVSITHIDHNSKTQSLEITTKIFTDDLERTIATHGGPVLKLGDPKEDPRADQMIFEYLKNRISLTVNGKPAGLKWVGKEVELDAMWCYLEVGEVAELKTLEVKNSTLVELFDDQNNVVHTSAGGMRKTVYLNKDKVSECIAF